MLIQRKLIITRNAIFVVNGIICNLNTVACRLPVSHPTMEGGTVIYRAVASCRVSMTSIVVARNLLFGPDVGSEFGLTSPPVYCN